MKYNVKITPIKRYRRGIEIQARIQVQILAASTLQKERNKNMEIGPKTIETINDSVAYMLTQYQTQINEAWQLCGEDPLTISIGVKLETGEDADTEITTKFSFVKEKVKDQTIRKVSEDQQELFRVNKGQL